MFRILQDPLDLIQPDWTTELHHSLECYNVIAQEEYEDLRNINIPEAEGHRKVEGPQIENRDITVPLKTKRETLAQRWNRNL